jgi:hypothetical protein
MKTEEDQESNKIPAVARCLYYSDSLKIEDRFMSPKSKLVTPEGRFTIPLNLLILLAESEARTEK